MYQLSCKFKALSEYLNDFSSGMQYVINLLTQAGNVAIKIILFFLPFWAFLKETIKDHPGCSVLRPAEKEKYRQGSFPILLLNFQKLRE